MKRVITYGTFDLLHFGHIKLLERAKTLGDYLIVGVTADAFDKARGKINVVQSLVQRIEAVRNTGLADEIIIEEYEGQKIDDIQRYGVSIFTVGDDWVGTFDYLKNYCDVIYLPRTKGISSTDIRDKRTAIRLGLVGTHEQTKKVADESQFVDGLSISGACSTLEDFNELLNIIDAVYIYARPQDHYIFAKTALEAKKHVLCESPICLSLAEYDELKQLAKENNVLLMDSIKTAYSTAYNRLQLLAKSGKIGDIISIDSVCTSLADLKNCEKEQLSQKWNSICAWGPTALLPIFQILGVNYNSKRIVSSFLDKDLSFDRFSSINFIYNHSIASIKVGKGIKSEGQLIISGTKGYIYVPAPWWKTDYFEIRFENQSENKRYYYQLDGEGIRYELVSFVKSIQSPHNNFNISDSVSKAIISVIENYYDKENLVEI